MNRETPSMNRRRFGQTLALTSLAGSFPSVVWGQGRRVDTIAGTGEAGYEPEGERGSLATETPVNNPYGVVPGPDGALYFCEVDTGRIRRIDLNNLRLSTIAGTGEPGYRSESRRPLETAFSAPHEIRWDVEGNLFVVERDSHTVRRIAGSTGLVSTVAGNGEEGFSGDGGSAVLSQLRRPHSIAFDSRNNLLICDIGNHRLRSVSRQTGMISTLSGTGERIATPDSQHYQNALLGPRSIDCDRDGNAYLVLREGNAVFKLDLNAGRLQRIAGTGQRGYAGDGGPGLDATFNGPKGIAYSGTDNSLYIVDTENHVLRRLSLNSGFISTVLGSGERGDGPDGDPLNCSLNRPHGVCVHRGVVYVTDSESHRIRAITGLPG